MMNLNKKNQKFFVYTELDLYEKSNLGNKCIHGKNRAQVIDYIIKDGDFFSYTTGLEFTN